MEKMKIVDIKTRTPFEDLFPIKEEVVQAIGKHIGGNGYDEAAPIVIWKEEGVVVDGHMRLRAARKANLAEIPVIKRSFKDEDAALDYAIHNQRNRRNLTDAEIMRVVEIIDERRKKGRPGKIASNEANLGKSSQITAQKIGTSPTKVEKVRTILGHADEKTKQAVKSGKMTIQTGYRKTQEKRQPVWKQPVKKADPPLTAQEIKSMKEILDCKSHCPKCARIDVRHLVSLSRIFKCKIVTPIAMNQKKGKISASSHPS